MIKSFKDNLKPVIGLALDMFAYQKNLSETSKYSRDLNVYLDGLFAVKHTGKHSNTLLSEGKGQILGMRASV